MEARSEILGSGKGGKDIVPLAVDGEGDGVSSWSSSAESSSYCVAGLISSFARRGSGDDRSTISCIVNMVKYHVQYLSWCCCRYIEKYRDEMLRGRAKDCDSVTLLTKCRQAGVH
eukprot:754642-Hanusia_phi.AAC.2